MPGRRGVFTWRMAGNEVTLLWGGGSLEGSERFFSYDSRSVEIRYINSIQENEPIFESWSMKGEKKFLVHADASLKVDIRPRTRNGSSETYGTVEPVYRARHFWQQFPLSASARHSRLVARLGCPPPLSLTKFSFQHIPRGRDASLLIFWLPLDTLYRYIAISFETIVWKFDWRFY